MLSIEVNNIKSCMLQFIKIAEEYSHDQINMTKWIWPKFDKQDQKIYNYER